MKNFTFIYSVELDKTNQKEITVEAENSGIAYAMFVQGLTKSATLVIDKVTGKRII